jgi:zinc/manganese transport system substrate-binding protein
LSLLAAVTVMLGGCGDDTIDGSGDDRPTVVTTTSVLGDVVGELVGDQAEVVTLMPAGVDPHDFTASAQDAVTLREADVVITSGAGFEEGLTEVIETAEDDGVQVYEAITAVDTIELAGSDTVDPHFFTDPARMAAAAQGMADELAATVPALDTETFRGGVARYVAELKDLDAEVEASLATIAPDDRLMVTSHEVFGYFADRYGFEVVGTVVPSGTTTEGASAGELADLATSVEVRAVPAVFADASAPDDLVRALADEVGDDVEVVELYSESLGEEGSDAETYVLMVTTNARRIADALG